MPISSDLRLVTKADAAEIFGVCVKTIDNYIRQGRLPAPIQFASKEYWHPDDFSAFLASTFKRSSVEGQQDRDAVRVDGVPDVRLPTSALPETRRASAMLRQRKDSNPVVRQRVRQKELLMRLNSDKWE